MFPLSYTAEKQVFNRYLTDIKQKLNRNLTDIYRIPASVEANFSSYVLMLVCSSELRYKLLIL